MAASQSVQPPFRREHLATYLIYIAGGIVIAPWSAIVPAVKLRNSMPDMAFAIMSVCFGIGAVISMVSTGCLIKIFGFKRMSSIYLVGNMVFMTALAWEFAPEWSAYPASLLWGAVLGGYEVSINVHSSSMETRYSRSLITGYTAIFTIGCVLSTLCFPVLMGLGMRLDAITLLTGAAAVALYCASYPSLGDTHGQKKVEGGSGMYARGFGRGSLACAGTIAAITYLAEGSIYDWSGVYLTVDCGWDISMASVGYLAYEACLGMVRYASPIIMRRIGSRRMLVMGSVAGAAAMLLISFTENGFAVVACCGLFGFFVACHVPVVISETGRRCGPDRAGAIGVVSATGYSGVLLGPALMGLVSMSFGTGVIYAADAVLLVLMSFLCASFMKGSER
jgi:predicted MFS family arabinose efflux permease